MSIVFISVNVLTFFFKSPTIVTMKISSNSWMVERRKHDQPMSKSFKLPEKTMDRGGFEMFWDTFDEITT